MMADSFFGFNPEFPSGLNVLGRHGLDEELLTDDVEEEYDALNDETFGHAANDDWEEAHEKLSELVKEKKSTNRSVFDDSFFEGDESQNEIVSKSISQLGLEDDLDDPAIMTIGRTPHVSSRRDSSRLDSVFGPSPPPPAILETELCGSPKTHSIWSTTAKDSGINSLLQSHSDRISSQGSSSPGSYSFDSGGPFASPLSSVWRVEELEKDLLSNSNNNNNNNQTKQPNHIWPNSEQKQESNHGPLTNQRLQLQSNSIPPFVPPGSNIPSFGSWNASKAIPIPREAQSMQFPAEARMQFSPNMSNYSPSLGPSPHLRPNLISPVGSASNTNLSGPVHSSPKMHFPSYRMEHRQGVKNPVVNGAFLPYPYGVNARMNMPNQMPLRGPTMPNYPPGFNFPRMNIVPPWNPSIRDMLLAGKINHPMFNNQLRFPMAHRNKYSDIEQRHYGQSNEDEYAGLMTEREKEWLLKIQMLLLKTENPYVEDYYYTTQVARRCMKKFSENVSNQGGGDGPQLVLPERSKPEIKIFVPTQFAGSLGKLQAVSVNFPRKVLDITVTRPLEDEEGKIVTNQSLMKYRRLLMDIEKLFSHLLEIDDEERRILALPLNVENPHRETILKLTKKLYSGLSCESVDTDDSFQNIMTIRKGRSLVMRAFMVFNDAQKLQCLIATLKCLPLAAKKDLNDMVLVQNCDMIVRAIRKISLPGLVKLGEALKYSASTEIISNSNKEHSFVYALKNKFGSSVICTMLQQAESLYSGYDLFEDDVQARWSKVVLHAVDCICALEDSSIASPLVPCTDLLNHFQRFAVDRNKFEILKEKLRILEVDPKHGGDAV